MSNGRVPWIGKKLSFGFENAMPLLSEFATIPVTTLADGWDPPRMSCMKNENGSAPPAVVAGDGPVGDGVIGATAAAGVAVVVVGIMLSSSSSSAAALGATTGGLVWGIIGVGEISSSSAPAVAGEGVVVGIWVLLEGVIPWPTC